MSKQRIRLTKEGKVYLADPIDQPGSPIVGYGDTPLEALVFLLCQNEKFNVKFIDETGEVLDANGVFPNGWNSRRPGR